MVGCSKETVEEDNSPLAATLEIDGSTYNEVSATLYEANLGEYDDLYSKAKEATTNSERWALMALAEAKLMESAVYVPTSSNGGNYSISGVAPYTSTAVLWGNDSYRYYTQVVTEELIKTADRDEMKAKYAELKGTGTYLSWVKTYLTDKGYTLKDSRSLGYPSDPQTWDVLATSRSADS